MTPPGAAVSRRYRILRPLSTGRMSHVWLAADDSSGMPDPPLVVVKQSTVPAGLSPEQQAVVRHWALAEAQAAARVRHPHVIHTLEVIPDDDGPWIVMEYLPSRSLHEIVQESGPLPVDQVARIGLAVLAALAAARRAGLLHLDLKPGNVLVADDGRVVLTDFGPAVTPAGIAALTAAGVVLGSPKYIAPERLFDRASTEQTDLWSLGATLYHAVEGRPPYVRPTVTAILNALADSPPDPPRQAGPLAPVITGLLRRDPADRLTAAQVRTMLHRVSRATGKPRSRPVLRRRITAAAAVVTVAATLTAIAGSASGQTSPRTPDTRPPSAVAAAAPAALPAGYQWWQSPSGFRVAVPEGWRPVRRDKSAWTAPKDGPSLRVTRWTFPGDPVTALLAVESQSRFEDYRRFRIEAVPTGPGAVWEYTYDDGDTRMRVVRRVIGEGERAFLLEWRTTRAGWVDGLPALTVALATFTVPSP